jgi:hypothetical protein
MKGKAVLTQGTPIEVHHALDSPHFQDDLERQVLGSCFQVPYGSMGPAEFYVQVLDPNIERLDGKIGCEFTISKVSDKPGRDFERAIKVTEALLDERIGDNLAVGKEQQIFVVIITVAWPNPETGEIHPSRTFESVPYYVQGRKKRVDVWFKNPTKRPLKK